MRTLLFLSLLCTVATVHGQAALSSSFGLGARAGLASLADDLDLYSDSQGASLASFVGTVSAEVTREGDYARSDGSGRAIFASSAAGSVTFDMGWSSTATVEGRVSLNRAADLSVRLFSYTFELAGPAMLTVDYNILGSGNGFGFGSWYLNVDNDPNSIEFGGNVFDPTASGAVQVGLSGGQHTFNFWNYGNVYSTPTNWEGRMSGSLDWSLTPVPEPASLAALALGLTTVLRRRSRK